MKKFLAIMLICGSANASAYWCDASSPSGWGSGWSTWSIDSACRIAIRQCRIQTPYWEYCSVNDYGW